MLFLRGSNVRFIVLIRVTWLAMLIVWLIFSSNNVNETLFNVYSNHIKLLLSIQTEIHFPTTLVFLSNMYFLSYLQWNLDLVVSVSICLRYLSQKVFWLHPNAMKWMEVCSVEKFGLIIELHLFSRASFCFTLGTHCQQSRDFSF